MKNRKSIMKITACTLAVSMALSGCGAVDFAKDVAEDVIEKVDDKLEGQSLPDSSAEDLSGILVEGNDGNAETGSGDEQTGSEQAGSEQAGSTTLLGLTRPMLIATGDADESAVNASVPSYTVDAALSNVTNLEQFYIQPGSDAERLLSENLFYVRSGYNKEFYEQYESNRYSNTPSFITVDSMMHTYHLYFSYLMKKTERNYLSDMVLTMSETMLEASNAQYDALKGTEWETAAIRNCAYFAIAVTLAGGEAYVNSTSAAIAQAEVQRIMEASAIGMSDVTEDLLDYSQFKPRGYYESDAGLERYFRTMMWYGQVNFKQSEEDMDRSSLLMNLAMKDGALDRWEAIYVVTSFFAGASDDLTYYEYMPIIESAYGEDVTVRDLAGNVEAWEGFHALTSKLPTPAINSIPTEDDHDTSASTSTTSQNKGFRFMGQRFTLDEAIFQQLIYQNVQENAAGDTRMLPDVLDVAAALGSDTALGILEKQGDTGYAGYTENMTALRKGISEADDTLWTSSLYANWLHTLTPLLEVKGEGYPSFMQSEAWATKDIESFAGSYAELKHDTILYAKQVMAEMGGGEIPEWDDRGYVEPEVKVWSRFAQLSEKTAEGLMGYGLLDSDDATNLERLADMAHDFLTMSEKELRNELLTGEEYDLIRNYGGNLEHFWTESYRDEGTSVTSNEFPAAIIADVATDPNGSCLEVGTGNPSIIYVIVPIDGELHICSGVVYSFYEFEQPLSDRLTDSSWRQLMGISVNENGTYNYDSGVDQPAWTQSYRMNY